MIAPGWLLTALHNVATVESGELRGLGEIRIDYGEPGGRDDQADETFNPDDLKSFRYHIQEDWIVLEVKESRGQKVWTLAGVSSNDCDRTWHTFGFPSKNGDEASGTLRTVDNPERGTLRLQLYSEEAAAGEGQPMGGYSGAPVVMAEQVVGFLVQAAKPAGEEEPEEEPLEPKRPARKPPAPGARGGTVYARPIQCVAEALDLEWTATRAPGVRFTDARETQTHFVGREQLLEQLKVLLNPSPPVVALTGMPGVGKSFLADHFATLHAGHFSGGVIRVLLEPGEQRSVNVLLRELVDRFSEQTKGVSSAQELAELVTRGLRTGRALLHVENADDGASSRAARGLVKKLGGAPVVVTGRLEGLGVSQGWTCLRVGSLDLKEALSLLERHECVPTTDEEAEGYRQLVKEVGGLPLALSIAASHLRARWTPEEFIAALRRDMGLKPTELPVETTELPKAILESSIGLGWAALGKVLDSAALEGLARLGHGPRAGCGASLGAGLSGLEYLEFMEMTRMATQMSLLQRQAAGRRWNLHPMIRAFLERRSEEREVLAAMTEWFVARLPKVPSGDEIEQRDPWTEVGEEEGALVEWLRRVPEHALAGVERAGRDFALMRGPYGAWAELCERLLAASEDEQVRSNAYWTLTQVARRQGELERAMEAAKAKLELDEGRGAERGAALAAGAVADILQARGEVDEALRIRREEELPVYEKLGDVRSRAVTMGKVADILEARGELDEALRIRREEQLPVYEKLGDVRGLIIGRTKLVINLLQQAQPAQDRPEVVRLLALALHDARRLRISEAEQIEGLIRQLGGDPNGPPFV